MKVLMLENVCTTRIEQFECEVIPDLYKIDLFLELPATLILPFSLTLKPLRPKLENMCEK